MRRLPSLAAFCGLLALAVPAVAQAPAAKQAPAATQSPTAAPAPAALKAARDVVGQMQGDRAVVLKSMSAPMVGLMQQMGIKEPDRAQALVNEVVLPLLTEHYDELLDVQAKAYASSLSVPDLQAIAAFYGTPAGRNLAAAQPTLAQAQMTGMTQWMGALVPEMQTKLSKAIQAHGWGPGGAAK